MTRERILFLVAAIIETVLAIPLLAAYIIYGVSGGSIWLIAIIVHIVALVLAIRAGERRAGSIMGIIANVIVWAWIPVVANILHAIAAVLNFYQAFRDQDPAKAIANTAKKASDAAEKAVDRVVDTAKTAGDKTADVAEDAAETVVDTVKNAGDAVSELNSDKK